jgi:hypothetical protein
MDRETLCSERRASSDCLVVGRKAHCRSSFLLHDGEPSDGHTRIATHDLRCGIVELCGPHNLTTLLRIPNLDPNPYYCEGITETPEQLHREPRFFPDSIGKQPLDVT